MISNTYLSLARLVAVLCFSTNVYAQNGNVIGCWRVENHLLILTDGSSRQERARCVQFYGDSEVSVACNYASNPDFSDKQPYQLSKRGAVAILAFGVAPYRLENEYEIKKDKMLVTSHYERPSKVGPKEWASSKTTILTRLQVADRDTCLSQAKLIPQETASGGMAGKR